MSEPTEQAAYRLREATRMKQLVVDLLKDLMTALQIISGKHHDSYISDPESWSSADTAELQQAEKPPRTPYEECLAEISHMITCLYKFSIAAQYPTPRDRLEKCADIDMSRFEVFEVAHVTEKFEAMEGNNYLIQRLGKAPAIATLSRKTSREDCW